MPFFLVGLIGHSKKREGGAGKEKGRPCICNMLGCESSFSLYICTRPKSTNQWQGNRRRGSEKDDYDNIIRTIRPHDTRYVHSKNSQFCHYIHKSRSFISGMIYPYCCFAPPSIKFARAVVKTRRSLHRDINHGVRPSEPSLGPHEKFMRL